ncbi:chalcone isomerase family protein [Bordetella avium]|uniref:chalcone isomerase family protein n=1 Tax=Bordetella avium TaxID=521 RepID=UPI001469BB68|nr:chalcone isomerase family protein [Bordetella avium]
MTDRLFSSLQCHLSALGVALWLAWASVAPAMAAQDAPPAFMQQVLPGAGVWGQGQLRIWGLRIYDARLWVGPQFDAADIAAQPLALVLTYHRAFKGADIARRSIEEIERQGSLPAEQVQRWSTALTALFPDVQAGERLTGLYQPGQGMMLWRGDEFLGMSEDAELARRFFDIWLSPRTSEPGLRSALLAPKS